MYDLIRELVYNNFGGGNMVQSKTIDIWITVIVTVVVAVLVIKFWKLLRNTK